MERSPAMAMSLGLTERQFNNPNHQYHYLGIIFLSLEHLDTLTKSQWSQLSLVRLLDRLVRTRRTKKSRFQVSTLNLTLQAIPACRMAMKKPDWLKGMLNG